MHKNGDVLMKDCILITGGAGFIGCALSDLLVERDSRPIVAIDCLHPQVHSANKRPERLNEKVELLISDVCEDDTWVKFLSKWRPSIVVHLAAETGTGQSLNEAGRHTHVNVTGTARMLDAFAAVNHVPERIVLSSSRAVYGEGLWERSDGTIFAPGQRSKAMLDSGLWDFEGGKAIPFESSRTPPNPTSIYGATKLAQEQIVRAWALSFGAEAVILRLQNVYGAGQSLTNPYTGIVSLFSRFAREGKSIPLYEDGLMQRDFVYISDVARALIAALYEPSAPSRIWDIGTGVPTTISDVAAEIIDYYGAPVAHVCGKYRNGDVRHAGCDSSRVVDIGWRPEVGLADGVGRLCDWIEQQLEVGRNDA